MFSARASRKFFTVTTLVPVCLSSSVTMAALSSDVSLGVERTCVNLVSFAKRLLKLAIALAVGSSVDVFAAAVN